MPALNIRQRQPRAALWYRITPALFACGLILIGGVVFTTFLAGSGASALLPLILCVLVLAIVVVLAYPTLYYYLFTYELADHTITVNSGILFRRYETIDFEKIQAIDNDRGPLLMLFGLTSIKIWTASADQLTSGVGADAARVSPVPDMAFILTKRDAETMRDFVMRMKIGA